MTVALIVAVAENGVIGRDNKLPWHIPEDLKWFKRNTVGKPVIMGRKTWDSIGRPLPNRPNIVLTRQPGWTAEGAHVVHGLGEALELAQALAPDAESMVIGGSVLFAEALPLAQRLYWTEIHQAYDGDAVFPAFDRAAWHEVSREPHGEFDFVVLER
jgi:dihydrofolate reductase